MRALARFQIAETDQAMSTRLRSLRRNLRFARLLACPLLLLVSIFDAAANPALRGRGAVRNPAPCLPAAPSTFAACRGLAPASLTSPWLGGIAQPLAGGATQTAGGTLSLGTSSGTVQVMAAGNAGLTTSLLSNSLARVALVTDSGLPTSGASNTLHQPVGTLAINTESVWASNSLIPAISDSGMMVNRSVGQLIFGPTSSSVPLTVGGLVRFGGGSVTLGGTKTYTGSSSLNGSGAVLDPASGQLIFGQSGTVQSVTSGGSLALTGGSTVTNSVGSALVITSSTPSTLNLGGTTPVTLTAPATAVGGTFAFPALGASATLSFTGNGTFALNGLTQSEFDNLLTIGRVTLNNTVATTNPDGSITLAPSGTGNASLTIAPVSTPNSSPVVLSGGLVVNSSTVSGSIGSVPSLSESGSAPTLNSSAAWLVNAANPVPLDNTLTASIASLTTTTPYQLASSSNLLTSNQLSLASTLNSGSSTYSIIYDFGTPEFTLSVAGPVAPPDLSGVPEPSSFCVLAGLALLGAGFRRRR